MSSQRNYKPKHHKRRYGEGSSSGGFRLSTFGISTPRAERDNPFGPGHHSNTPEPDEYLSPSDVERGDTGKKTGFWHRKKMSRVNTATTMTAASSNEESSPENTRISTPVRVPGVGPSPLHRYPPTPAGNSDTDAGLTIAGAAKVLKSTVLHDARNLKGKDDQSGGSWDITSAHEAKVWITRGLLD